MLTLSVTLILFTSAICVFPNDHTRWRAWIFLNTHVHNIVFATNDTTMIYRSRSDQPCAIYNVWFPHLSLSAFTCTGAVMNDTPDTVPRSQHYFPRMIYTIKSSNLTGWCVRTTLIRRMRNFCRHIHRHISYVKPIRGYNVIWLTYCSYVATCIYIHMYIQINWNEEYK